MRTLRTTVAAISRHTNHLPPSTGSLRIIAAKASSPRRFYSQKPQQTPSSSSSPHVQEQQQPQTSPSPSPQVEQQQQHPPEQTQTQRNYYKLFPQTLPDGPPPQSPFKINLRALRREYLALQAQCHPDKQDSQDQSPSASASAATTPQNLSSLINEAYRTLKDPLLRAEHILAINGLPTADDQTTLDDIPPEARTELFTTVWQEHEKLGRAEKAEDLEALRDDTRRRIEASEATMGHAFEERDLQKARWEVVRLRYWVRIQEAVREWPEGLAKEMREWGE